VIPRARRVPRRGGRIHRAAWVEPPGPGAIAALDSADTLEASVIDLGAAISANLGPIIIALVVGWLVLLAAVVVLVRRTQRLATRLANLTRGGEERSLEAILDAHLRRVHQVAQDLEAIDGRATALERDLKRTFARVGLVRFNPFEDTGGNQSFALALLDSHGDGFVVSSLHGRNMTRMYAKGVKSGRADAAVSDEEAEALRVAMAPLPVATPAS
jgi:hypothetical protein